jgi:hypothetical protein
MDEFAKKYDLWQAEETVKRHEIRHFIIPKLSNTFIKKAS